MKIEMKINLESKRSGIVWGEHGDAEPTQHGYERVYRITVRNKKTKEILTTEYLNYVKANSFCSYWNAPREWQLVNNLYSVNMELGLNPSDIIEYRKNKWHDCENQIVV